MMKRELSILIPVYNGDCRQMVSELCRQAQRLEGVRYELVMADDGSSDRSCVALNSQMTSLPGCRFIDRGFNSGRAAIRNFLAQQACYEWLLFIDCGLTVISPRFLQDYLDTDANIIYGGYHAVSGASANLRYRYEKACESQHSAEQRRKRPFLHFRTCNFMVRRDILLAHPFDERFRNYGYEDVFFGKQLREAGLSITHIDNPIGCDDFEENAHFICKTEESLHTLYQFRNELRGYSRMLTLTDGIHLSLVRSMLILWHRLAGHWERRLLCSHHAYLNLFKLYKIGYYLSIKN